MLTREKFLSEEEYERVYAYCRRHLERPESLFFLLLMHTGCRCLEGMNLTRDSFHGGDEPSVTIRACKGSRDREIPIPVWLYERVMQYPPHHPLIRMSDRRLREAWDKYRPVPKPLHSLRHTFAIRLYCATRDIRMVQYALGHRSISNTQIYVEYIYSQKELRSVLGAMSGKGKYGP